MTNAAPQFAQAVAAVPSDPVSATSYPETEHFVARVLHNEVKGTVIIDCAYASSAHVLEGEAFSRITDRTTVAELREFLPDEPGLRRNGPLSFARTREADHLQVIQIETLLKCNLTCAYCYCAAGKQRTEALTTEQIKSIIVQAERMGVLCIDFTGGEFMLRPDWRDLVVTARAVGLNVSLHTNGTALNRKNVAFIAEVGVQRLQVSMDGHTSELHDSIRGGNDSFAKTMEGVRLLKKAGMPVHFAVMVHKGNIEHFGEIYSFFVSMGSTVLVDMIAAFGSELNAKTGVTPKEYYEATISYFRESGGDRRINRVMKCGSEQNWAKKDYKPNCGIGHSYMFITATGEMAICPQLTSREDARLFGGPSITEMGLEEAWRRSPFFAKHRHSNCSNVESCPAGTVCKGGCRADAYALTGNYEAPDVVECNHFKNPDDKWVDFEKRYDVGDYSLPESAVEPA